MTTYENILGYYRDLARLVEGASLRALYDAMLGVQSADLRAVDSPRRLREMAQGWSSARISCRSA